MPQCWARRRRSTAEATPTLRGRRLTRARGARPSRGRPPAPSTVCARPNGDGGRAQSYSRANLRSSALRPLGRAPRPLPDGGPRTAKQRLRGSSRSRAQGRPGGGASAKAKTNGAAPAARQNAATAHGRRHLHLRSATPASVPRGQNAATPESATSPQRRAGPHRLRCAPLGSEPWRLARAGSSQAPLESSCGARLLGGLNQTARFPCFARPGKPRLQARIAKGTRTSLSSKPPVSNKGGRPRSGAPAGAPQRGSPGGAGAHAFQA